MYSVYLHIPFCRHRCAYCDFNTYAGLSDLIPAYVNALCREIACYQADEPLPVHTIYFGGGTPSLLSIPAFTQIFTALRSTFNLQPSAEISLEANPGTLSLDYLRGLHTLGFNRISLGVQSARPDELRLLERQHDVSDVIRAVMWARQAGFDNINLDLIYGLPLQTVNDWQRSLALALDLHPQHLSLYALTVEEGTPLDAWVRRGLLQSPDPDLAADMYDLASDILAAAGFVQYEISNWARELPNLQISTREAPKDGVRNHPITQSLAIRNIANHPIRNPGYACQHNLQYWRNLPYLGLGAGAHGYFGGQRVANVLHPTTYITRLANAQPSTSKPTTFPPSPAAEIITPITRTDELAETMMMGLRLTCEGVSDQRFSQRFNAGLRDIYAQPIERLIRLGMLEWMDDVLRLTPYARLLGNQVFMEFL
jgi:oxygen-independent coproporphyrinogen-3 oxidase